MRNLFIVSLAVFTVLSITRPLYAADSVSAVSDQEMDARLNDLQQSLASQQTSAEYWEYGWGVFDGSTMIWSAVEATQDHDYKDRSTDIVQAAESLIGLADVVFRPLPAFYADSVCNDPVLTREEMQQCLANREALLERSAERANEPYEILPHLGNFGFNLAAGLLVGRLAGTSHALTTAIPGEIIGELQLWSTPKEPLADLDHYKLKFGPMLMQTDRSRNPVGGVMVTLNF